MLNNLFDLKKIIFDFFFSTKSFNSGIILSDRNFPLEGGDDIKLTIFVFANSIFLYLSEREMY
jgi:hypothetical protein